VEKINIIDLSVKINQTINNSSLEVSAVASKLDCEEERAAQFAYYLKEKEDNTENKLIIGSIIIAAAGAIAEEATADTLPSQKKQLPIPRKGEMPPVEL